MRAKFGSILICTLGLLVAPVQAVEDEPYLRAILTLQAVSGFSSMFKDWCDEHQPQGNGVHAAALKKWRETYSLDAVDARGDAMLGSRKGAMQNESNARRSRFYAQLDQEYKDTDATCQNLEKQLFRDFNPQKMYPEEYQIAFSRPSPVSPQSRSILPVLTKLAAAATPASSASAVPTFHASPGNGLQTADILGVMYDARSVYTVSGLQFQETAGPFLLKNGKAYRRADPPEGLDAAKSQRLEPTLWGQWRPKGNGYKIRWPNSDWRSLSGTLLKPYPPGTTLNAAYIFRGFSGSVSYGGISSRSTYVFKPNGRFELLGFSLGSAGSMAAMNGFSSSTSTSTTGEGSSTVSSTSSTSAAGGELPVTATPNLYVGSSGSKADGADHRGTYRLNGYTLQLAFDSGRKSEVIAFPWGKPFGKYIWLGGRSYSNETAE